MERIKKFAVLIAAVLLSLTLISCGSSSSTPASSNTPTSTTLSGTAATGAPIAGFVYAKDATGTEVNVATGTTGSFTLDVTGMTPPFMVRVVPDNSSATLYSYASAIEQIVNVTPLTNLTMFLANSSANLDVLYNTWNGAGVTGAAVIAAQKVVNANLLAEFTAAGLSGNSYDFMTTAFAANGLGFDAVLDALKVVVNNTAGSFTLADVSNAPLGFNAAIDVSAISIGGASGSGSGGGGTSSALSFVPGNCILQTNGNNLCTPNAVVAFGPITVTDTGTGNTCTVDYDGNGTLHFEGGGQTDTLTVTQFAIGGASLSGPTNIIVTPGSITLHIDESEQIDFVLRVNPNFSTVRCQNIAG
ncbi:MAG: hypothetical protein H8E21_10810 [Gammaproteobacteria bacterium]|nr:hypothetical protein [Gammaproteobacteria bacterium]MBL6999702.1 hypothetical protein [Gammaproteobacteria bacterium]